MATTRGVAHHPGRESTLLRQARRAPRHRARTEDRVAEDVGGREKGAPEGPIRCVALLKQTQTTARLSTPWRLLGKNWVRGARETGAEDARGTIFNWD